MAPLNGTTVPVPLLRRRLSDALRDLADLAGQCGYTGYQFVLVGRHPGGDPFYEMRIPCPAPLGTVPVEDGPAGWDGITAFLRRAVPGVAADAECVTVMVERPGCPANVLSIRL